MKTLLKSMTVEKMDDVGHGLARIAILSAIDNDGDTYAPGAFSWKEGGEQWVHILPAHNRMAMPLGKARIYEEGDAAYAELHLNMETEAGRDWHKTLKFDLAKGTSIQEWSYGYGIVDADFDRREGRNVQVLKRLDVHEVSPVVRGAGIGSATLSMKSRGGSFAAQIDAVLDEIEDIVDRAGSIKALREAEGRSPLSKARLDQLAKLRKSLDDLLGGGEPGDGDADANARAEAERLAADFLTMGARRRAGL